MREAELRRDLGRLGPQGFLEKYLVDADHLIRDILHAFGVKLPPDFDKVQDINFLSLLRIYLAREFNKREKLSHVITFDDVVTVLGQARKVIVITGAGISTSLGIPDFRSENGIYSRLEKYHLSDPQELFDIHLFRQDPSIFYDFCKELVPEDRGYSATHAFIRVLQDRGILLRQYTQNIDDIESTAGILDDKLIQCHGSFKTATCLTCHRQSPGHVIFPEIKAGRIPKCQTCLKLQDNAPKRKGKKKLDWDDQDSDSESEMMSHGVMKPDITFFGEQLDTKFKDQILQDRNEADLVLCIGTSLRVAPVAEIPNMMPKSVPQVFISREPAGKEYVFDVELLGACDEVVRQLAHAVGWSAALDDLVKLGKSTPAVAAQKSSEVK